jgi:Flp pilus assembly protein TadD
LPILLVKFHQALVIKQRALSEAHPDLAMTRNNLAVCYMAMGRQAEARALFEQALPVLVAALDPAHPHLALCRENYAALGKTP